MKWRNVGIPRQALFLLSLTLASTFAFLFFPPATVAFALDVPPLTGRIVDQAHILSPDVEARLSAQLAAYESRTGTQIAVLTIPSLQGASLEAFAHRVATTWHLGTKQQDNGVVLLIVPGDRRVRFEVGYGLEGVLPDVVASRIIRQQIIPKFRTGDLSGGVTAGIEALQKALDKEPTSLDAPSPSPARSSEGFGQILLGVVVGAFVGGMIAAQYRPLGSLVGAGLAGLLSIPAGFILIVMATGLGGFGAWLLSTLFQGSMRSARRTRDWGPGWYDPWPSGGWGLGGGSGSGGGDVFSGGGGDFGGGGASGEW